MSDLKYQVVIPTVGGREKYLAWTLRTCIEQDYPNIEILVSNNGGSAGVRDLVSNLNDPRIRHIETDRLLPMAEHWDFAMARADGDVMTIIGDDDALMPGAIATVDRIFLQNPGVECVTHYPGQYYWPDFHDPLFQNKYHLDAGSGSISLIDTKPVLKRVSEFREWYGRLPFLYHGFVRQQALARIVNAHGLIFKRTSPDIYSDLALAIVMDKYARYEGCLTVGGQGAKSNGANFFLNNELGKQFIANLPAYLEPKYYPGNIQIQIFESIEMIRREFGCNDALDVDWIRFAKLAISEAMLSPAHCDKALVALAQIARENFPLIDKSVTVSLISLLRIGFVMRAAQGYLQKRQLAGVAAWQDAKTTCGADNIYSLVHCVAKSQNEH